MDLYIKEVPRNNQNRHSFRQIARESSGAIFEAPDGSRMFFLYKRQQRGFDTLLAVGSATPADHNNKNAESSVFTGSFYHVITYMFVLPNYQNEGLGTRLLKHMEPALLRRLQRPLRVQSSYKAVRFFEHHGYVQQGDPIDCVYGGSSLFKTLFNMQKDVPR